MSDAEHSSGRRNFLKKGIACITGVATLPSWAGSKSPAGKSERNDGLIRRTLGKTGIRLPIVSIGAVAQDPSIYKLALDRGIVHIDTSQYYLHGQHERVVGEAVRGRPRDSFVIATSILLGDGDSGRHSTLALRDASRLAEQFNSSLGRLGLREVDIFYVAATGNRATVFNEDLLNGLRKIKKAGKARFVGVAAHENEPEVLRAAVECRFHDVVLVAHNFRQQHREEVRKSIAEANQAGLGIVVMKPMAGAYWDKERRQPINGKAALKWVLQDENVHTAVPGITNLSQLETDLSVMDGLELTSQEKADLKLGEESSQAGLYCQQCGACRSQCPAGLEIPALMRSYMYAYGYKDLSRAKAALEQAGLSGISCAGCQVCRVSCLLGMDVRDRIQDISRLKAVPEEFLG